MNFFGHGGNAEWALLAAGLVLLLVGYLAGNIWPL